MTFSVLFKKIYSAGVWRTITTPCTVTNHVSAVTGFGSGEAEESTVV